MLVARPSVPSGGTEFSGGDAPEATRRRAASCCNRDDALIPPPEVQTGWSPSRRAAAKLLNHEHFDTATGIVIVLNIVVMILDTNANAECDVTNCSGPVLFALGYAFLGIYTCELAVRLFALRLQAFRSLWTFIDLLVVVTGLLELILQAASAEDALPDTGILKIVRMARLARTVKFLGLFPSLRGIIKGFASAMLAMFWGGLAISAMLLSFSILAVELVHPENKALGHKNTFCAEAFSSVQMSLLFLVQNTLIGDSWGECLRPLILEHWYFGFLFVTVFVVVQLGLMNLILTAVVDEANKAHEHDTEQRLADMQAVEQEQMELLRPVFQDMDIDGSGSLTTGEILTAYDRDPRLQKVLSLLRVDRDALVSLFELMDDNGDGHINYDEFAKTMKESQMQDIRMQMMTLKLQMSKVLHGLKDQLTSLSHGLSSYSVGGSAAGGAASCVGDIAAGPAADVEVAAGAQDSRGKSQKAAAQSSAGIPSGSHVSLPVATANDSLVWLESELEAFRQGVHLQVEQLRQRQLEHHTSTGWSTPSGAALATFAHMPPPSDDGVNVVSGKDQQRGALPQRTRQASCGFDDSQLSPAREDFSMGIDQSHAGSYSQPTAVAPAIDRLVTEMKVQTV